MIVIREKLALGLSFMHLKSLEKRSGDAGTNLIPHGY